MQHTILRVILPNAESHDSCQYTTIPDISNFQNVTFSKNKSRFFFLLRILTPIFMESVKTILSQDSAQSQDSRQMSRFVKMSRLLSRFLAFFVFDGNDPKRILHMQHILPSVSRHIQHVRNTCNVLVYTCMHERSPLGKGLT